MGALLTRLYGIDQATPYGFKFSGITLWLLAADAGIVLANVMGLFLQACLYEVNGIEGAAVPWRLPGCRERW